MSCCIRLGKINGQDVERCVGPRGNGYTYRSDMTYKFFSEKVVLRAFKLTSYRYIFFLKKNRALALLLSR